MRPRHTWFHLTGILLAASVWSAEASRLADVVPADGEMVRAGKHPFYISVCQIDYNAESDALEMSFRIFTDDLELALESMGTGRLHLGTEREAEMTDEYIGRYLSRHIELEVNGLPVDATFLGKEVDTDAIWCYVEIGNVTELHSLTIKNTLLLETFEDQVNLVHVTANDRKKSLVFNRLQTRETLDF